MSVKEQDDRERTYGSSVWNSSEIESDKQETATTDKSCEVHKYG